MTNLTGDEITEYVAALRVCSRQMYVTADRWHISSTMSGEIRELWSLGIPTETAFGGDGRRRGEDLEDLLQCGQRDGMAKRVLALRVAIDWSRILNKHE
ncbi:hypothetical protein GQ600_18251 [Phytophthora cactorum]|nr:hypothetical protein GQ600_18251 [Phytophthora cactorum]